MVEYYKIPKRRVRILVKLPQGDPVVHYMFLSPFAQTHQGGEMVSDVLAQRGRVLPLMGDDNRISIVFRSAIQWVRVFDPHEVEWHHYETRQGAPRVEVVLRFADGEVLEGAVYAIGPRGEQRVQDVINRREGFLHLEAGADLYLVNLDRLCTLTVVEGDQPLA
jgi:hypothetical protein